MKLKTAILLSTTMLIIGFAAVGRYNTEVLSFSESETSRMTRQQEPSSSTSNINDREKAEKIVTAIMRIDEVENASVIIIGNSAIIGVEVLEGVSALTLSELKRRVERESLAAEFSLNSAAVTTSEELTRRIKKNADFTTHVA